MTGPGLKVTNKAVVEWSDRAIAFFELCGHRPPKLA